MTWEHDIDLRSCINAVVAATDAEWRFVSPAPLSIYDLQRYELKLYAKILAKWVNRAPIRDQTEWMERRLHYLVWTEDPGCGTSLALFVAAQLYYALDGIYQQQTPIPLYNELFDYDLHRDDHPVRSGNTYMTSY